VRDSYPSHGSSIPKTALAGLPACNSSYANIARYCIDDNAGNISKSALICFLYYFFFSRSILQSPGSKGVVAALILMCLFIPIVKGLETVI
jgi:hypothetical protein